MRLVTYQSQTGPRVAGLREGGYVDLNRADPAVRACVKALLAQGPEGLRRASEALAAGQIIPAGSVSLLAPVPSPEKIICVGLNYADHARETGAKLPAEPVLFNKFPTAASADGRQIVLPAASREVDYEAELVVVIGRGGRHISEERAYDHVAAYCCGNDVSARDWQLRKPGGQWLLGKSFDTFAPFGPALVTPDEVDVGSLRVTCKVNGEMRQDSNTDNLIHDVPHVVEYITRGITLQPGDVIATGTPAGVGVFMDPPKLLKRGDTVELEVHGLGKIVNRIV